MIKFTNALTIVSALLELLFCDGAGIMCLIAASLPQYYLNDSCNNAHYQIPSESLEYACRGKLSASFDGFLKWEILPVLLNIQVL